MRSWRSKLLTVSSVVVAISILAAPASAAKSKHHRPHQSHKVQPRQKAKHPKQRHPHQA
jgi:hypothetical protein